jgi:transcriptional regulator of acetoin/glycerol metabolism
MTRHNDALPAGADPLLWYCLQRAAALVEALEAECLDLAADARERGMSPDHIAQALRMSRSTLYRKMEGRW